MIFFCGCPKCKGEITVNCDLCGKDVKMMDAQSLTDRKDCRFWYCERCAEALIEMSVFIKKYKIKA